MIRHHVHLRFKSDVNQDQKEAFYTELAGLSDQVEGMIDLQHRRNKSPETPVVRGFHDVFWIDFKDAKGRDTYLTHPAHLEIAGRLVAQIEGGPEGVFVCDVDV